MAASSTRCAQCDNQNKLKLRFVFVCLNIQIKRDRERNVDVGDELMSSLVYSHSMKIFIESQMHDLLIRMVFAFETSYNSIEILFSFVLFFVVYKLIHFFGLVFVLYFVFFFLNFYLYISTFLVDEK